MLLKLKGGRIYDPAHDINGEVRDIYVRDGRIVPPTPPAERVDRIKHSAFFGDNLLGPQSDQGRLLGGKTQGFVIGICMQRLSSA